ncbi:MAG: hypothetical protein QOG62_821 [Thermoleophilaceae bacterium]|jgi:hypothetical protein|nr:hypothetical protein [Thermoleophilaceae bacterium]
MLTRADDFPVHQTPEPIAFSGSNRNFYDRYWFGGYAPDGSEVFELAFGVYPAIGIADAHFAVLRDGVQYGIHASRHLAMERMDLEVGPISISVDEPLQRLTVKVADHEGISAELSFEGRAFPLQEPRFTWKLGPRAMFDYTRFTQNGGWSGWIEVDGNRRELPSGSSGTRDRSWGIRPVGEPDTQPHVPEAPVQFFWVWSPVNLGSRSTFFHLHADADGRALSTGASICPDGTGPEGTLETSDAVSQIDFEPGTRYPSAASITIDGPATGSLRLDYEPLGRFYMGSLGYWHPTWGHGRHQGPLVVEREDVVLADINPADPSRQHVHTISKVIAEDGDGKVEEGIGVFETAILGPYAPYGFTDLSGPQS